VPGGRARWTIALLACLVLAAGAGVQLAGGDVPNPIYLWFYAHLPFFDRLWFPYRFASVAFIPAVVLVVSLWRRLGAGTLSGAVLFCAGLGVQIWHGDWPLRHHDARPPAALAVLTSGSGGVIVTPIGIQHDGLMWQTEYGLPTFGGMGESAPIFWPEGYRKRLRNTFIRAVADAGRHPGKIVEWSEADRAAIEALGFRWVVLRLDLAAELGGPSAPDAARASVERILGTTPRSSDDRVVVWSLSDPSHLPVRPGPIAPGSSGDTFP